MKYLEDKVDWESVDYSCVCMLVFVGPPLTGKSRLAGIFSEFAGYISTPVTAILRGAGISVDEFRNNSKRRAEAIEATAHFLNISVTEYLEQIRRYGVELTKEDDERDFSARVQRPLKKVISINSTDPREVEYLVRQGLRASADGKKVYGFVKAVYLSESVRELTRRAILSEQAHSEQDVSEPDSLLERHKHLNSVVYARKDLEKFLAQERVQIGTTDRVLYWQRSPLVTVFPGTVQAEKGLPDHDLARAKGYRLVKKLPGLLTAPERDLKILTELETLPVNEHDTTQTAAG